MDKLKEEVVRDVNHLRQVIKICEGKEVGASRVSLPERAEILF